MKFTDYLFALTPLLICLGAALTHRQVIKSSGNFRWYLGLVGILLSCGVFWGTYMVLYVLEAVFIEPSEGAVGARLFFAYWGIASTLTLVLNRTLYARVLEGRKASDRFVSRVCAFLLLGILLVMGIGYFVLRTKITG